MNIVDTITFFIAIGLNGIFILFFMLVAIKTPAFTFLKAWIKRVPIMLLFGKEQIFKIIAVKKSDIDSIMTKQGIYFKTQDSCLLEEKTKTPTFFSFSRVGATMPPTFPAIIQNIKEKGQNLHNFEDFKKVILDNNIEIDIQPFKTLRMHDVANMFPFNVDPAFVEEKISNEVKKNSKLFGMVNNPVLLLAGGIAVCGIIALIWLITKGKIDCNCIAPIQTGIQTIQSNLTA